MIRVFILLMFVIVSLFYSCMHHNTNSTLENKTVNTDSIKKSVQEKFNATLAALDSAIGASHNTLSDSLHIEQLRDSANRLNMLLDSMGVAE